MKYFYKVTGYDKMSDDYNTKGVLINTASIIVLAENEKEAISKAKTMVKKPLYRISEAREFDNGLAEDNKLRQEQQDLNRQVLNNNIATKNNILAFTNAIDKLADKVK